MKVKPGERRAKVAGTAHTTRRDGSVEVEELSVVDPLVQLALGDGKTTVGVGVKRGAPFGRLSVDVHMHITCNQDMQSAQDARDWALELSKEFALEQFHRILAEEGLTEEE